LLLVQKVVAYHILRPKLEQNPILIGVVAIQDPPRPEVTEAIRLCRNAGISVIMITGDIKETAQAIGKEIGIVSESELVYSSFTGQEFEQFSPQKQKEILTNALEKNGGLLFSRAEPKHKKILVKELANLNQIVAMTGDGVNDAPALKQANIGIAMGINGTEVAKEASDMVLADDNFATIVKAVEEGRAIFANMKAFIRYMISSNIGEVVSIFMSSILGIPDGFNSIQLLWVNLVTDGLPATALSFNPPDPEIMNKPPRKHDEPIITPWVFTRYVVVGTYVGLATVGIFIYWYCYYDWAGDGHTLVKFGELSNWSECVASTWTGTHIANYGEYTQFTKDPCLYFTLGKQKASTLSLTVLVMIEMFNALNALSEDSSLLTIGLFCNPLLWVAIALSVILHCAIIYIPFLGNIFGTDPLSKNDWILVIVFSFPVCLIDEVLKFVSRQRIRAAQAKIKKDI
jgi:Ca2+-transporting ATPase